MRLIAVEVTYGKKFPTGRYRVENVGVSLRAELDSNLEDGIREIYKLYEQCKEIVEVQARQAKLDAEGRTEV